MKLVGKVPVEPLDDERLTNIERKLVVHVSEMRQQPMRAPRRLLALAGIGVALAVAVLVGWKLHRDPAVMPPTAERFAMNRGVLDLGDAQITGKDFAVTRTATRTEIEMKPGKLELEVDHKPGRLFVVKAGAVEIEDVGTKFSVDYDGKNVDVRVTEGEVKVKHAGKELSVKAGNAWTIEIGPITIAQLDTKQAAQVAAQIVDPSNEPLDTSGTMPGSNANSSGNSNNGSNANSGNSGNSVIGSGSGSGQGSAHKSGTTNGRKALENAGYDAPPDAGTDEPKAAITSYLERIKSMPEGEDKALMLYGIAVMRHRLKQDGNAKYTISGLLKRQGGPAYQKALWLNVRISCLKAFDDECRMAAEKYISKFESGVHAGVAQEILREISRGQ
jgi:hypothetical protein